MESDKPQALWMRWVCSMYSEILWRKLSGSLNTTGIAILDSSCKNRHERILNNKTNCFTYTTHSSHVLLLSSLRKEERRKTWGSGKLIYCFEGFFNNWSKNQDKKKDLQGQLSYRTNKMITRGLKIGCILKLNTHTQLHSCSKCVQQCCH